MYNYLRILYHLFRLMRSAYWSPEKLREHQNKELRRIVRNAYENVPFYHEKFKTLGLKPGDIRTVEDLNKIPVIRRKELQRNAEKLVSKKFKRERLLVESTSGSTGRPLRTYITKREDEFRKAKLLRANISCGQRPRDRWVVVTAPQERSRMARMQRLLGVYVPITLSVFDEPSKQISVVKRVKPDVLEGYSTSLLLMAKELEKTGMEISRPRILIGEAEMIDRNERFFIEKEFGAQLFDQYGSVELEVVAWQCEEKGLYHIDADTVFVQFVDENGEEVSPGERGEIVCTSLFNYAMPFIRYAVGDVGVAADAEANCSCGRTLPLMKAVEGRKDSLIVLPGGRVVTPLTLGWAMEFFKFYYDIDQYRVVQKKIDALKFLIKVRDGCYVDKDVMAADLVRHLRKMLNVESEVVFDVEFVDEIPLDRSGKLRKVISEISVDKKA
ncbi:MAG: phenylacetate--CoA ligase family protein [Candidatus Freyarchaeota archaeon]